MKRINIGVPMECYFDPDWYIPEDEHHFYRKKKSFHAEKTYSKNKQYFDEAENGVLDWLNLSRETSLEEVFDF